MSCDMKAAWIGLVGALLGSLVTYIVARKQLVAQEKQFESERLGRDQDAIVGSMADFLTEYTADEAKNDLEILRELDRQLERLVKSLHLKGHRGIADEMSEHGGAYLMAVGLFARDAMSREDLGRHRISTREKITVLVGRLRGRDV